MKTPRTIDIQETWIERERQEAIRVQRMFVVVVALASLAFAIVGFLVCR